MTLVDQYGRVITKDELAACYAADLRSYTSLSDDEIDARLRDRYPAVMRRLDVFNAERERT